MKTTPKRSMPKYILQSISGILFMGALIFLSAGRLDYWQGWTYLILNLMIVSVSLCIFRNNLNLIMERQRPGPGMKWWDKVFYALFVPANLAYLIIGALDTGRYHWSPELSWYWYASGFLLYIISHLLKNWSMYANPYFSSVVRIQEDRGQQVITGGPYRYVRHPGYTSAFFLGTGTALVLGSLWALIPAGMVILLILIRTRLEDRTLKKELKGYPAYTLQVPYRLIPGVW